MKIEICDLDRELVDQRMVICQIEGDHEKLEEDCLNIEKRLNALLAECQATLCKTEDNTVTQTQIDIHAIGRTNQLITLANTAIEKEISRLSIELKFIIEKERVLYDFIRFGTFRYTEELQEIE